MRPSPLLDFFGRFRRRLGARLDGAIAKLENHEALVASAVRELEGMVERAEHDHARARGAAERLRLRTAEEREAAASWRERAVREHERARGVECLRRSKHAERQATELAERYSGHEALERKLDSRASFLRERLAEFREREAWLRARAERSDERTAPERTTRGSARELALLLERWESEIGEAEQKQGPAAFFAETFDDEPLEAAEEAELQRELDELKEKRP